MARGTRVPAGVVCRPSSVTGFKVVLHGDATGVGDYLEVDHENAARLCLVQDCQRVGPELLADCLVVGQSPKTPFLEGAIAYRATEETIRVALELTCTEESGLYVGSLKRFGLKVWLPVKKIGRVFIVGKPGSGKSHTVGVLVEELLKKSIPVVVIDPHGEYSSLKVEREERDAGRDDVEPRSYIDQIIEFADLEMNRGGDLSLAALRIAEPQDLVFPGICGILNLRGLSDEEQQPIVSRLLGTLFEASAAGKVPPFFCVLDEAHRFAGKEKTDASLLVRRFAQEGRKFGANLIVVTQRPQLLDTTVRGLVGTWIIHRLSDPNDVKIVMESGGLEHRWEREITWLEKGEALATGEIVEKTPLVVKVRPRETRDGAPGFNPLDFVTPEARAKAGAKIGLKKLELIKREAESFEAQPVLAPGLPQCFPALHVTDSAVQGSISGLLPRVEARLSNVRLEYLPAIQFHVRADVARQNPKVEFEAQVTGLASLSDPSDHVDWRQQDVCAVSVSELDSIELTTRPPQPGRYAKLHFPLKEPKELDSLVGSLKAYAALETTKVVLYHRSLGFSAVDTDAVEFQRQCQKLISRSLDETYTRLNATSATQLKELDGHVKEGETEVRQLAIDIKRGEVETQQLREELRTARRAGRQTKRVESSITSHERKLTVLKTRLEKAEQRVQRAYSQRSVLAKKREVELAAAKAEAGRLAQEELGREVLQPTPQEIRIATLQLAWIPLYHAEVTLSRTAESKTLAVTWNGVNGNGSFGLCATCGKRVEKPSLRWICGECLSPLCADHVLACSKCGKTLCRNHASECGSCGQFFCKEEALSACALCRDLVCTDCAKSCVNCGPTAVFCTEHLSRCDLCGNLLCVEHHPSHFTVCSGCSGRTCHGTMRHCAICGDALCPSCVIYCSSCGLPVCKTHSWTCPICHRIHCEGEASNTCGICGRKVCLPDSATCPSCGQIVCLHHAAKCADCGRDVCANCTVTYRRLLVRRTGCRLCVGANKVRPRVSLRANALSSRPN